MRVAYRKYKGLIKLGLSILMLWLIIRTVDFSKLQAVIQSIPLWALLVVVGGYAFGQVLSSFKWWLLSRAGQIDVPYTTALRAYFIGMFVNFFGFGTVGGDIARGLLLAQGKPFKAKAVASVVADRLHGLAVLALIGSLAALAFGTQSLDITLVVLLVAIGPSVIIGWFFGPPLALRILPQGELRHRIASLTEVFPRSPQALMRASVVSTCFHLLQISLHFVMARSVGADIPWASLLVVIPFVNMISTLPISWNGLGVRENAYVFFLTPLFLSKEQALALGAIWFVAVTVTSSLGGLVSVLSKEDRELLESADDSEAGVVSEAASR